MSKAVLISIRPQWCDKIASGRKTMELRKSKPKVPEPFKCYIYCTQKAGFVSVLKNGEREDGKVIGEFVCDYIMRQCQMQNADIAEQQSLVKRERIFEYANGKEVYGWHISDLEIYDTPKALSEFKPWNRTEDMCYYSHLGYAIPKCANCRECKITCPPQSWRYVEVDNG